MHKYKWDLQLFNDLLLVVSLFLFFSCESETLEGIIFSPFSYLVLRSRMAYFAFLLCLWSFFASKAMRAWETSGETS